MKKQTKKSKNIEGMQTQKMGKPVHRSEHTSHSVETDSKGKRHHRVHHHTEEIYEYPDMEDTAMNNVLSKRGY